MKHFICLLAILMDLRNVYFDIKVTKTYLKLQHNIFILSTSLCLEQWHTSCIKDITKTRLFKYKKNFTSKNENFEIKQTYIFHISAQNIDCGYSLEPHRRDGSNEYPQSMFLTEIRKIMYTPVNPSFTI